MRRLIIPSALVFLGLIAGCSCDSNDGGPDAPCPDGADSCGQACVDVNAGLDSGPGFACGEACDGSTPCPSGYYCSDADVCSADCWADGDEFCPGGTCDVDGRCDIPDPVDAGPDANFCETQALMPQALIPDIVIALDRSGSMAGTPWTQATSAVKMVASTYEDVMRLGFITFPTYEASQHQDDCQLSGSLDVPIALNNATSISTGVDDAVNARGGTPTTGAMLAARDALLSSSSPAGTPGYVILIADGQSNCACDLDDQMAPTTSCTGNTTSACMLVDQGGIGDWPNPRCAPQSCADCGDGGSPHDGSSRVTKVAIDNLFTNGIRTFVIGFSIPGSADSTMSAWGAAGNPGHDYGGGETYLAADNEQELIDAISDLASAVVPCDYELDQIPSDPSYVRVTLDGDNLYLNQDPGWTISGATVTLTGTACDTLQDGSTHDLVVQRECEQIVVP